MSIPELRADLLHLAERLPEAELVARSWVHADDHSPKEKLIELSSPQEVREFVELLATDYHISDAILVHTGRPEWETAVPDDDHPGTFLKVPDHEVIVGVRGERGAMSYSGGDGRSPDGVHLYSLGHGPDHETIYESGEFPPNCEIPIEDLTKALIEFLETAKRPLCIKWQKDPDIDTA